MFFGIFTELCDITTVIIPKRHSVPIKATPYFVLFHPLTTTNLLFVPVDLPVWTFCVNGIMYYVVFCDWLLPLA